MSNSELYYFEEELSYLREKAPQFAMRHPSVAAALGISKDTVDDPEIARMIEGICLLNSRIQKKLDDDYSIFTESMLRILYPDFLRSIPSYAIIAVDVDSSANSNGFIPKGTMLDLSDDEENHCFFRVVSDLSIYPVKLDALNVYTAPFDESNDITSRKAKNLLSFHFTTMDESVRFSDVGYKSADFYIRGEGNSALRIYDEIRTNIVDVYLEFNGKMHRLGVDALGNKSFDMADTMVPYSSNSSEGFCLLNEFFMFQDSFCRISVNFEKFASQLECSEFTLKIYLKETKQEFIHDLQKEYFTLFAVPVVNLYSHYADPLTVDFLETRYPVIVSGENSKKSLYSIDRVMDSYNGQLTLIPFIYDEHFEQTSSSRRWEANYEDNDGYMDGSIQIIDTGHNAPLENSHSIVIETTVTDGFIPTSLNNSSLKMSFMQSVTVPGQLKLLRRPSYQINPRTDKSFNWDILAHMKFNFCSFFGTGDPLGNLKHLFKLYNHSGSAHNNALIDSIKEIKPVQTVQTLRIDGKCCSVCGTRFDVILSTRELKSGIYLFAEFLDKFLSFFVSYNSFSQLQVFTEGSDDVWARFPRRMGCRKII